MTYPEALIKAQNAKRAAANRPCVVNSNIGWVIWDGENDSEPYPSFVSAYSAMTEQGL